MKELALVLSIVIISIGAFAQEKYAVVKEDSKLEWKGYKPGGEHNGIISISNGKVEIINQKLTGGSFEIDMTSFTIEDIEKQDDINLLTRELTQSEFFYIEKFPLSTFTITKVSTSSDSDSNYTITGNLKIRDNANEISFPANVKVEDDTFIGEATITFNRQDWNLEMNNFIKEMALKNDIQMKVKLVAKK